MCEGVIRATVIEFIAASAVDEFASDIELHVVRLRQVELFADNSDQANGKSSHPKGEEEQAPKVTCLYEMLWPRVRGDDARESKRC